jgi:cbb3-type cytochrome oxidase subunit 3
MADSFVFQVDWTVVVIIIFLLALVLVNFVYRRRNRD